MEMKSCRACKKLFSYTGGKKICAACRKKEEEFLESTIEYVRKNPGSTIKDIHKNIGVPVKLVEEFIREGNLILSNDSPITVNCTVCGKPIKKGSVCDECAASRLDAVTAIGNELTAKNKAQAEAAAKAKAAANKMFINR